MKNQSGRHEPSVDEDETSSPSRKCKRVMKQEFSFLDPLVVFGCDIMLMILACLDAHSVASSLLVSRKWWEVGSSDVVWSKKFIIFTRRRQSPIGCIINATIKVRRCDMRLFQHIENHPIHEEVYKYIRAAGFAGIFRCGFNRIDHALVTALVERWRPETHTFHFPIGEVTVTLEDVQVIYGLPIDGPVVSEECMSVDVQWWQVACNHYIGFTPEEIQIEAGKISIGSLVYVLDTDLIHTEEGYQQRARVYILAMLDGNLFSDSRSKDVSLNYLSNLDDLSEADRLSWGSAVLANLYRNLCVVAEKKDVRGIQGPLMLLQC